jgi:hypothetical protein
VLQKQEMLTWGVARETRRGKPCESLGGTRPHEHPGSTHSRPRSPRQQRGRKASKPELLPAIDKLENEPVLLCTRNLLGIALSMHEALGSIPSRVGKGPASFWKACRMRRVASVLWYRFQIANSTLLN